MTAPMRRRRAAFASSRRRALAAKLLVATVGLALLVATSAPAHADARSERPTQWRFAQRVLVYAEAGQEVSARIGAFAASVGYPDWLTYKLFSPTGEIVKAGRLKPGDYADLSFRAGRPGVYTLDANPGNNTLTVWSDAIGNCYTGAER